MKISGSYSVPAVREETYRLLQDPEVLARAMPGCNSLVRTAPDEYDMQMNMVIASIQGLFSGKVRIAEQNEPAGFRLILEGKGKVGFLKGDGLLNLDPRDNSTEVHYAGDVQVGGVIAGVGQRLLDTTAKMLIRKFFERLVIEAGKDRPATG